MADKKMMDPSEEMTEIYLMKDSDRYKGDVFVSVNGVGIMIPRGEKVMVKKKYADVIRRSMDYALSAASYADSLAD